MSTSRRHSLGRGFESSMRQKILIRFLNKKEERINIVERLYAVEVLRGYSPKGDGCVEMATVERLWMPTGVRYINVWP